MRESLTKSAISYPTNLVDDIYDGIASYERATESELMEVNAAALTSEQIEGLNFALNMLNDQQREIILGSWRTSRIILPTPTFR